MCSFRTQRLSNRNLGKPFDTARRVVHGTLSTDLQLVPMRNGQDFTDDAASFVKRK